MDEAGIVARRSDALPAILVGVPPEKFDEFDFGGRGGRQRVAGIYGHASVAVFGEALVEALHNGAGDVGGGHGFQHEGFRPDEIVHLGA